MITEDFVSLKTAKLLKEKGFDEPCIYVYRHDGSEDIWDADKEDIACQKPTLQMAMKWLREVHNIFFNVNYFHLDVGNKWVCLTIWLPYKNGCECSIEGFNIETIYDSVIKYCLENLI